MDDLHVDSKLAAVVIDNQDTNRATAGLEGVLEARPQVGLLNDGQCLLNITSLGHGNNSTILHVENTVLLEDRALHGLDNHTGSRVGDAGALFVQLLGEEVDTKVAVLASGSRCADADDLAWATLKHQDVAETDVVAGNGNCATCVSAWVLIASGRAAASLADFNLVFTLVVTHLGLLLRG